MKTLELSDEEYTLIMNQRRSAKLGVLASLIQEKERIDKDIDNATITQEFKKIGFTLLAHTPISFSFINYSKEKVNDEFYAIRMKDGVLTKDRDDITDEDFEAVKNLLKLEEDK